MKRPARRRPVDAGILAGTRRRAIPHEFVVDAIAPLAPATRLMFGAVAVYVGEKIVFILRDREAGPQDNGVWLATTVEHHASLQRLFPHMRSIRIFGEGVTGWQILPVDAPDFEAAALEACALVRAGDPRIGKVPKRRRAGERP